MIDAQLIQTVTLGLVCALVILIFVNLLNLQKLWKSNREREKQLFELNALLTEKIKMIDTLMHEVHQEIDNIKHQRMNEFLKSIDFDFRPNFALGESNGKRKNVYYNHDEIVLSQYFSRMIHVPVTGWPKVLWKLWKWFDKHNCKRLSAFFFTRYFKATTKLTHQIRKCDNEL